MNAPERYPDLGHGSNTNNKLLCTYYAAIREHNPKLHVVGQRFRSFLREDSKTKGFLHLAEVVDVRTFRLHELTLASAAVAMGQNLEESKKAIINAYKNTPGPHPGDRLYSWLLLHRLDVDPRELNY